MESRILNYQVLLSKWFPEKWLFWREVKPFSLVSLSADSTELRIASKASRWRLFGSLNTKQQYALLLYLLQLMLALQLFEGEATLTLKANGVSRRHLPFHNFAAAENVANETSANRTVHCLATHRWMLWIWLHVLLRRTSVIRVFYE